ncbi:hypothetical protein DL96DRAFT_1608559 [Flagelloscypha sp. PMI_526]|nr:hypothetical protein DL96DRAFT_1608559 [Flagelloscypha sp. PMI_526]
MYDLRCFISGVSTFGGPQTFLGKEEDYQEDCDLLISGIVSKLLASENATSDLPSKNELREILADLLKWCVAEGRFEDWNPIPRSMNTWNREVVIIGPGYEDKKNSDGTYCIQLQVCRRHGGYSWYEQVLSGGQWKDARTYICYNGSEPNVFMDARCWYYLRSWITFQPLAPAVDPEISFHTELWKLVTGAFKHGYYPSTKLDYFPFQFTLNNHHEPPIRTKEGVRFSLDKMCLDSVPNLRQALRTGTRGLDLGAALLNDFQIWAFESPDIWPCWSEAFGRKPVFMDFVATSTASLCSLPLEILLEIFADATPYDVLNMASTCKSIRHFLVRQDIFSGLLREMVRRGSLYWLNPSPFAGDEVSRANQSLTTWIGGEELEAVSNPFQVPGFPFIAFVHTCFVHSFSMKSRRRLWGIIKQVERRCMAFKNGKRFGGEDDPDKWQLIDVRKEYGSDSEED